MPSCKDLCVHVSVDYVFLMVCMIPVSGPEGVALWDAQ